MPRGIRTISHRAGLALCCSLTILAAACSDGNEQSPEPSGSGVATSEVEATDEPGSDSPDQHNEQASDDDAEGTPDGTEGTHGTEDSTHDNEEAANDDEDARIPPASMLGPGTVGTTVGDLRISLDLPEELEGGNVAPGDLPVSLELLTDGGAIVVFEAVGHTSAMPTEQIASQLGIPADLTGWLTEGLPGQVELVGEPTILDDGAAATLRNDDAEETVAIVLWGTDGWESVETLQGHGPPPQQSQQLWLRQLDDAWVGVVTYGPEVDPALTEAIATSISLD